jgi:hypothetical protein
MKIIIWLSALLTMFHTVGAETPENVPVRHGVAVPVSSTCGVVTTANRAGEKLLLSFLGDASGCPLLLQANLDTGRVIAVPVPLPPALDMQPMYSLLSSRNRYYAAFNGSFYEYDPEAAAFSFCGPVAGKIGMGMTEDDRGVIWCASWPGGELSSFDPVTRTLTDYGRLVDADWQIYQRHIAADDAGWIYFGVGNTEAQIYAFHPDTRTLKAVVPAGETAAAATGEVQRAANGKVYGWLRTRSTPYFELHAGEAVRLAAKPEMPWRENAAVRGHQFLMDRDFPDGSRLETFDPTHKFLAWTSPDGGRHRLTFDYPSRGVNICGFAAMADGTLRGGAAHPKRYFIYRVADGSFDGGDTLYQWNAMLPDGARLWVGGYGGGALIDWDTARAFEPPPGKDEPDRRDNPKVWGLAQGELHRPSAVRKLPDGRIIMAGTPGYGRTGGGLAVFDPAVKKFEVIPKTALFGAPAALSLLPLEGSRVLIGGTAAAGTGGRRAEGDAPMMIFDLDARQPVWTGRPMAGVESYLDLLRLPDGRILGVADRTRLFVFDPETRQVTAEIPAGEWGRTVWQQGPRILLSDGNRIFVLFERAVAEFLPAENRLVKLADVPTGITAGGAIVGNRIYFANRAELWSVGY